MTAPPEIPDFVSRNAVATLIAVSPQRLDQLVRSGVVPKEGRGRYSPAAVVAAYVGLKATESARRNQSTAADELRDARAHEVRLRTAKEERELIPMDDAMADLDFVTGRYITTLDALPAMITRDQRERNRIVAIIDECRERLSAEFAKAGEALATGKDPYDA